VLTNRSIFVVNFFLFASLSGLVSNAAAAQGAAAGAGQCVGKAFVPPAARPRMTLKSVEYTSGEQVVLSWEALPGAAEYQVFREPRCPTQPRIQVATVRGDVSTWTDQYPKLMAWYSVESKQIPGKGMGHMSNAIFFDLVAERRSVPPATPPSPAAPPVSPGAASSPRPLGMTTPVTTGIKAPVDGARVPVTNAPPPPAAKGVAGSRLLPLPPPSTATTPVPATPPK
jgi:hypothetical protein